jgi:4'-phosphopantetheinyl transferase
MGAEPCAALLSEAELQRCLRLPSGARDEALVARAMTRSVLSRYVDVEPGQWRFDTGAGGKPHIADDAIPLAFNLSHSRGHIAVAVTSGAAVGVDIESGQGARDVMRLARRFFAPAEVAALDALPASEQADLFYAYWTLKEAWIKAHGGGVWQDIDSVAFDLGRPEQIRAMTPDREAAARFWLLQPGAAGRLALCVLDGAPEVPPLRVFRWRGGAPVQALRPGLLACSAGAGGLA